MQKPVHKTPPLADCRVLGHHTQFESEYSRLTLSSLFVSCFTWRKLQMRYVLASATGHDVIFQAWLRHLARCIFRCILDVCPAASGKVASRNHGPVSGGLLARHRLSPIVLLLMRAVARAYSGVDPRPAVVSLTHACGCPPAPGMVFSMPSSKHSRGGIPDSDPPSAHIGFPSTRRRRRPTSRCRCPCCAVFMTRTSPARRPSASSPIQSTCQCVCHRLS